MRVRNALLSVALAALIISGVAAASSGAEPTPEPVESAVVTPVDAVAQPAPVTILLMGDSYTAGNGARNELGERTYYGPAKCLRSRDTWGEQYADNLAEMGYAVTLLNRACSAATTDNMLNDRYLKRTDTLAYPEPEPVDAPRSQELYADWAATQPLCTPVPNSDEFIVVSVERGAAADGLRPVTVSCAHWLRPQVDALNPDVDLVLFTVGGNDAHFPDIMRLCLVLGSISGCEDALATAEQYVTEEFAADLAEVFDEMHARTEGNAKVVYLGYPRLEVSTDLMLTGIVDGELVQLPVAAELDRLIELGAAVQREAVAAANERHGEGFAVFLDGLPELFAGHEPDARPGVANAQRWIAEAFDTNMKDEWYHFRPEGQAAIAEYVTSFGTFGVAGGDLPARDLALVTDGSYVARMAVKYAVDAGALGAARVSIVEQRPDAAGTGVERRIVGEDLDARGVAEWAANGSGDLSGWHAAADVALQARWNAAQQVVYVGDAALGVESLDSVWSGVAQGIAVSPRIAVVDTGRSPHAFDGDYVFAPAQPGGPVAEALAAMAAAPHAWAAGPYTVRATGTALLDASGSFGVGELTYAWDLDGDGVFEVSADGPGARVPAASLHVGWVALRVTTPEGISTVSKAWAFPPNGPVANLGPACAGDIAMGGASLGGEPCQPLGGGSRWYDGEAVSGSHIQPSASADAETAALVAWIADPELFFEERETRSLAISIREGRSGTRASSPARRRPRQLVQRERALDVLVDAPSVLAPARGADAAGFALAA